jgi:DNA-binding CsgD family transcriptional regulator
MDNQLYACYNAILNAKSLEQIRDVAQQVVEVIGFKHFMYLFDTTEQKASDLANQKDKIISISTYPTEWIERYTQERYYLIDPAALHVRLHQYPLPWRNETFSEPSAAIMYAEAKKFDISSGITCPVLNAHKEVAGLGMARGGDADEQFADTLRALPYEHLLTCYIHEAVVKLLCLNPTMPKRKLTAREKQCIKFAALGLSDDDIASNLNISMRTVRFHLGNAKDKLGATTRSQMIARGIETNIIGL